VECLFSGSPWTSLDGNWSLFCTGEECEQSVQDVQIQAKIPGDLLSDLKAAGIIEEPLFERNFKTMSRFWTKGNWTYLKHLSPSQDEKKMLASLVFDGIKMGAVIRVDGVIVEKATDQFLRYVIPIASSSSIVAVSFEQNMDEKGRFMACSGGWVRV